MNYIKVIVDILGFQLKPNSIPREISGVAIVAFIELLSIVLANSALPILLPHCDFTLMNSGGRKG
jgi:hypothetical protein